MWTKSSNQSYEELTNKKQSIQELSLMSNQTLVAEVQNEDGTWPRKSSYSKRYFKFYLQNNVGAGNDEKMFIFTDLQIAVHLIRPSKFQVMQYILTCVNRFPFNLAAIMMEILLLHVPFNQVFVG